MRWPKRPESTTRRGQGNPPPKSRGLYDCRPLKGPFRNRSEASLMRVEFRLDLLAALLPLLAQRAGGGWEGVALDVALSRCRTKSTPPQPSPSPAAKGRERITNRWWCGNPTVVKVKPCQSPAGPGFALENHVGHFSQVESPFLIRLSRVATATRSFPPAHPRSIRGIAVVWRVMTASTAPTSSPFPAHRRSARTPRGSRG